MIPIDSVTAHDVDFPKKIKGSDFWRWLRYGKLEGAKFSAAVQTRFQNMLKRMQDDPPSRRQFLILIKDMGESGLL